MYDSLTFYNFIVNTFYTLFTLGILIIAIKQFKMLYDEKYGVSISFSPHFKSKDTKSWTYEAQLVDFILENRGHTLYNLKIVSEPDNLGWGNIQSKNIAGRPNTSDYFNEFYVVNRNEVIPIFWCDLSSNKEVLLKPFKIKIYYSTKPNKKAKQYLEYNFDFSNYKFIWGVNHQYNIHNVAEELARLRELVEKNIENKKQN